MSQFRIILLTLMVLPYLGCQSEPSQPAKAPNVVDLEDATPTPDEKDHWQTFTTNEWYELSELRMKSTQSVIRCKFFKTDAQLGIGISADIAVLAQPRGFKYFRTSSIESLDANGEPSIGINDENESQYVIDFYKEKPEDASTDVLEVDAYVQIAELRDAERID
ncbi:MAG: hypothetical protein AAFN77_14530 [Planctomycetota bacterium]